MKKKKKESSLRVSLMISIAVFILAISLIIDVLAALIIGSILNNKAFAANTAALDLGALVGNTVLWNLIIGSVITVLFSRILIRPINKILNVMNQLASGDYSARLSFHGPIARAKVFREITDNFNKMASELQQTEMLRSDFINNFSHEFKTPIVSIAGFAQLLRKGAVSKEEQNEYLDVITEESLRLSHMATNVLELTRVENQTILTDVTTFNLSEQLRTCILMLENKWSSKQLEFALPEEEYYISGNEDLMKQVWVNLIDNAIKFSQEYGLIEIIIHQEETATSVSISDFGEQIPSESMQRIFQKFYQSDESHNQEGYGVGLAIVKKVIDLHQGQINVSSTEEKTTFTVTLHKNQ